MIVMAAVKAEKKTVKIRLHKDNDKYRDDVQVIVNGQVYLIKRGIEVEVPDFVAEVLEHAQIQAQYAAAYSEKAASGAGV